MAQGPAVPAFILRGHLSSIHALRFFASNLYLSSGDGDGWVVVWHLATKRPAAVWKGHEGGVMGLREWGSDRLISHGRDHQLRVWQLRRCDYDDMDVKLPTDGAQGNQNRWPWLLFSLSTNALNYCAFAMCDKVQLPQDNEELIPKDQLVANPNGLDAGGIDVFELPSCKRICRLPSDKDVQTGMVMALSLVRHQKSGHLTLISGYESGHIIVHNAITDDTDELKWVKLMCSQPHTQPVLAINSMSSGDYFLTSSADAMITKFEIPCNREVLAKAHKSINTKHAGQQDLQIRDDDKIFATAGWDKRIRVYSAKSMKELAVLKWHQDGCYAVAFAKTITEDDLHQYTTEQQQESDVRAVSTIKLLKVERNRKAQNTHWLAAGGKDGKISLWDIY